VNRNVGDIDRIIRFVLAVIGLFSWLMRIVTGVPAIVVGALSLILLLSSLAGVSLLYALLGISTKRE
jgi:hypothetical protein